MSFFSFRFFSAGIMKRQKKQDQKKTYCFSGFFTRRTISKFQTLKICQAWNLYYVQKLWGTDFGGSGIAISSVRKIFTLPTRPTILKIRGPQNLSINCELREIFCRVCPIGWLGFLFKIIFFFRGNRAGSKILFHGKKISRTFLHDF